MTDYRLLPIAELELSVRTHNCCVNNGVKTIGEFCNLNKAAVMSWQAAGAKTWKEISEVITELNPGAEKQRSDFEHRLLAAADGLNALLDFNSEYRVILENHRVKIATVIG